MNRTHACLVTPELPDRYVTVKGPPPTRLTHCGHDYVLTLKTTHAGWPVYRAVSRVAG